MTDYAAIKTVVDGILQDAGVTFSILLVGETSRPQSDGKAWKCDAWRVTLATGEGNARFAYETDYFTGLGHRKPVKGAPSAKGNPNTLYREQWEKQYLRPQAPRAADVLHSLILDSSADGMSFRDWCSDYGYSDDSISAFDTYRQCCDVAVNLRRIFRPETLNALRDAVQEL